VPWDGTLGGLPSGWDEGLEPGMTSNRARTALMAIAISVLPERQGEKLSSRMIQTFTDNARVAGLTSVIAPVRTTWKERYPLISIERYVEWRSEDGSHFDPWIRIHERVGGEILASAPESMTIRTSSPTSGYSKRSTSREGDRLGGERDDALLNDDEAVALQGANGVVVESVEIAYRFCDEAKGCGAALAERALERPLLAGRLLADTARRALGRQRAIVTAWDSGKADGRSEIHQRLCCI